jgi:urea transporter
MTVRAERPATSEPESRIRRSARGAARFGDAILRGYAQIYFCNHPGTGALFVAATVLLFPVSACYALAGLFVATAVAHALRQDPALIRAGLFGYNAALVGLAWAWFYSDTPAVSVALFVIAAAATVPLVAAWLKTVDAGRLTFPALSVPFVVATWAATAVLGPVLVVAPPSEPSGPAALAAIGLTFAGMAWFSRRLAVVALYGAVLGVGGAILWGVPLDVDTVSMTAFNTVPTAIALGGYFVVWGPAALALVTVASLAVAPCWVGLQELLSLVGLVPLTAPFCLVTLACLVLIRRQRRLARRVALHLVPLVFASAPEEVLAWFRRQRQAEAYWRRFSAVDRQRAPS